jgi:cytochrome oxidase assembly protein ShyY1
MPRVARIGLAILALAGVEVCGWLGMWQWSRWRDTRALESARRAALAAPGLALGDTLPPLELVRGRVVAVRGVYDTTRAVLMTGATHDGAPGVELAVPLRVGSRAVLVRRGWLPADDGVHADLAGMTPAGANAVRGLVEPMKRGAGDSPRPLAGAPGVLTARWLDADSLGARLPYRIADWSIRELPSPDAPPRPVRLGPAPFNPGMHLSYAIQWWVFATAFAVGAVSLLRSLRRARGA